MNKNCENIKNSDSCYSCYSCDSCYSCYSCYSCNYCNSCYSCYSCYSCNSCYYCNSCYSCYSCYSCNSCYSCYSCNYCYSCKFSYGLRMAERMIFCLGEGKYESKGEGYQKNYRIFNKEVEKETFNKIYSSQPSFKLPVSVWIDKEDMTKEEIKAKPICNEIGGYLKVLSYKDAWTEGWKTASKEFKEWVKNLPNFDTKIFKDITGLDIQTESLKGKKVKVELDGVSYTAIIE